MYSRKKRGFSMGFLGKKIYVWFSTDERDHVDCMIANDNAEIISRAVAFRHDTDEFSITEGEDIAFDKALNKLYARSKDDIYAEFRSNLDSLEAIRKGLNNKMRHHLNKEERLETKIGKKSEA